MSLQSELTNTTTPLWRRGCEVATMLEERGQKRTLISNYGGIYNVATVTVYNPFLSPLIWLQSQSQASSREITNIWRFIYTQSGMINSAAEPDCGQKTGNLAEYDSHTPTHTLDVLMECFVSDDMHSSWCGFGIKKCNLRVLYGILYSISLDSQSSSSRLWLFYFILKKQTNSQTLLLKLLLHFCSMVAFNSPTYSL